MTIGIPGSVIGTTGSFGLGINYIDFVKHNLDCDDLRILLPDSPIYTDLDLLILTGGADINPTRYDEIPNFYTDKPDIIKEYFDTHALPRYIDRKIPIFGICRGIQTLAVHFGGKLYQDMYHETNSNEKPWEGMHGLKLEDGSKTKIKVNSRHHQSVIPPQSQSPIKVLATHSAIFNHIEAIRIEGYPICAVQWHPEDLIEESGVRYTLNLIKTYCKK